MWTKILFFVLAFVLYANADTNKFPGPCPDIPAVENFDEDRYATGWWYLVDDSDDDAFKCVRTELNLAAKTFRLVGIAKNGTIDRTVSYETVSPGVYNVVGSGDWDGEARVIATDYDNYAISYMCSHDSSDDTHKQLVYIDVREKHANDPAAYVATAKSSIEGKGILVTEYHSVDHSECVHH